MVKYLPTYKKKKREKIINFFNNKILDPTPLNRSFLPKEKKKILKYLNIWYFILHSAIALILNKCHLRD